MLTEFDGTLCLGFGFVIIIGSFLVGCTFCIIVIGKSVRFVTIAIGVLGFGFINIGVVGFGCGIVIDVVEFGAIVISEFDFGAINSGDMGFGAVAIGFGAIAIGAIGFGAINMGVIGFDVIIFGASGLGTNGLGKTLHGIAIPAIGFMPIFTVDVLAAVPTFIGDVTGAVCCIADFVGAAVLYCRVR